MTRIDALAISPVWRPSYRQRLIVVNMCDRGDKDIFAVAEHLGVWL